MNIPATRRRAEAELTRLSGQLAVAQHEVSRIEAEQSELDALQVESRRRGEVFTKAGTAMNLMLEECVGINLKYLTEKVNLALQAIIPDQDISFEVVPKVSWGKQVYSFGVRHQGVLHTDAEGIGGTPLTVVSLVLRVLFIKQTKRFPLMVLDESIRFISKSHKKRASEFISALAETLGVHILLVTHDVALAQAAGSHYAVRLVKEGPDGEHSVIEPVDVESVRDYFEIDAD